MHIDGRPRNAGRKHRSKAARGNKTIGQVANEVVGVCGGLCVCVCMSVCVWGGCWQGGQGWRTRYGSGVWVSDIAPMVITTRSMGAAAVPSPPSPNLCTEY